MTSEMPESVKKEENGVLEEESTTTITTTTKSPISPSLKHPLEHSWTLWFFKNNRMKEWKVNQKPITTFDTVEDFWALYNHIELTSCIDNGCDYSLFKKGIWPMWEDKANKDGGRWLITLDKKNRTQYLDNNWLEVMLCLIGEAFDEHSSVINGAVVSVRPKVDKIAIWLGDASKAVTVVTIGKRLKERLGISKMGFEAHEDTMKKSGSVAKLRFSV